MLRFRGRHPTYPLGQTDVDALVGGGQVPGVEEVSPEVFDVTGSDGIGENCSQVVAASWRDSPVLVVEERVVDQSGSHHTPAIPESAGGDSVDSEAAR